MKNIKTLVILYAVLFFSCRHVSENTEPVVTDTYSETWKFHNGEGKDSLWMNTDCNDMAWQEVTSTKLLNDQGITLENGFGWYRKTVQFSDSLRSAIKNKGAIVLHFGRMASCEEVYFNGKLIGKTGGFPPDYMGYIDHERNYLVTKENINTDGDNVIAIKFNQGWGAGGFLDNATLKISSAETKDKMVMDVAVSDSDYIFMSPDPISIVVNIDNKNEWDVEGELIVKLSTDNHKPVKTDSIAIKIDGGKKFSQSFELKKPLPGFYKYTVQLNRKGSLLTEKIFTVGYEPEKIKAPADAKADFRAFWDNSLKELAKVAPNYKLTLQPEKSNADYDMYIVEMKSFGNELIRGYYAKPKKEGKHPVIVEYMGYGSAPFLPNTRWNGFAYFVLSTRGQGLNQSTNRYGNWIVYGLDNKENYYYRGAFLDLVRAIDFVAARPEIDGNKIAVKGGSQGGAFSFAAAALDKRVKVAAPTIPFLSDYPRYFQIARWPKADFDKYMEANPDRKWNEVYDLLTYFDIKNLAQYIECPLIMGIGVQDNVCPPHINFAAYNQVKTEKRWMAFPRHGHSVGKEYDEASMKFIKEKLNIK